MGEVTQEGKERVKRGVSYQVFFAKDKVGLETCEENAK